MKSSRTVDMAKLRRAISGPGIDTRTFVSYGTVATDAGEDGGPSFTDGDAVVVSPLGAVVDVLLEPHGVVVPCRYGQHAGVGFEANPIRPGDQVVVLIPDGDLAAGPEIVKVIPSADRQTPVDGAGLPYWKNDRVLKMARGVPFEIAVEGKAKIVIGADGQIDMQIEGGGAIRVNTDGTVQIGGESADHPIIKGDTYRDAESARDQADAVALTQVAAPFADWAAGEAVGAFGGTYPQTTALLAAMAGAMAALLANGQTFEAQALLFLSSISKTR